jgi:HK97 family phage major capsid protein
VSLKRLDEVDAELALIEQQIDEINNLTEPEGGDAVRAQILSERDARLDDLITRHKELGEERQPLLVRAQELDAIRASARDRARVEPGDGTAPVRWNGTGPQVMSRVQPYEGLELVRAGVVGREDMIGRAKAATDTAPKHLPDDSREKITRLLEDEGKQAPLIARHMLMTGSDEYHQQFREYIESRGAYAGDVMRAALSLTDANGGYLVPFTLDPTIILTNSGIAGSIRSISTNKTIATDAWHGVTSAGVTAEWLGEGTQAADATPTFGQPTITPQKAAAWVFGSYEVLADSGFAGELQMLLADAKMRLEEAAFATGNTGASVPRGAVAAVAAVTNSIVSSATITSFVVGDVYRVADALRPRDASSASWIANKGIFSKIRQMDTSGSSAFWANLGVAVPSQLLGQPIYECSTMGAVITTSANILLAGNFKQYYVVDRVGMSVLYEPMVKSTNANRPTGQAGWFAFWRVGADVVDADAFRLLQLHTTPAFTALG